jgi:lysophospholipase L1-like esterase
MTTLSPRVLRSSALAAGCAGLAIAASLVVPAFGSPATGSSPATHTKLTKHHGQPPVVPGSRYLALGDSVSFGYRESNSIPAPNFNHPKSFVGFPEDVAANLGLKLANASCPGETTASFMNTKAQSNGCENSYPPGPPGKQFGYRTVYPLHVKYASATESQLTYAERYLKKYPNTRLVTLMIGANDGFLCLEKTKDDCVLQFGALQKRIEKHVTKILKALRNKADYNGQIVLVTYYSVDNANSNDNLESKGLNTALVKAAKPFHVRIANGYKQFRIASAQGHHNECTAQLLTAFSGPDKGTCGVHPSRAGAALLAQAVEQALTL